MKFRKKAANLMTERSGREEGALITNNNKMKKTTLLLPFLALVIISITFVYAGSDSSTANFNLLGCSEDKTPVSFCSGSGDYGIPFYCSPDIVPYKLTEKCVKCGCLSSAIWCNPSGTGKCAPKPANLDCGATSLADCIIYLGVCFVNRSVSKCQTCPDKITNLTDCSFYRDKATCEEDGCFLGKTGFGVGFYESPYVPVDYSCEWYVNSSGDGSCRLGYTTIDSQGIVSRCKTTQKLSACVNEIAQMEWKKTCVDVSDPTKITETSGNTAVSCGKAASPLPFFNTLNLVIAVSVIFLVYSLALLRKKRKTTRKSLMLR